MIFFDLDDTLINTHKRHFTVVYDFIAHFYPSLLNDFCNFKDYLSVRKKNGFSNVEILKYYFQDNISTQLFNDFFLKSIENEQYLNLDSLIINPKLLNEIPFQKGICSLRSDTDSALKQLKNLSLDVHFKEIYFLKHSKVTNPKKIFFENRNDVIAFFGDSISDYYAVNNTNIKFYGVKTGLYILQTPNLFTDINIALQEFLLEK